ncbi:MAG: prephenate dehydratase [Candidatus Omnitrophica bacterium]|nr:prephenate dehydratase [Candidatus Omnitrophota bacterium]
MDLKKLRRQIDRIDLKILELLNQRARISLEIARLKKARGMSLYSPTRAKEVLDNVVKHNTGLIPADILESVFTQITSFSLALERQFKVAYLGPEASFTHLAAIKKFGDKVGFISCEGIGEVFKKVELKEAEFGVVPVENSIEGMVNHTLDMFITSELNICSEIVLRIEHCLLANISLNKIKKVYSHPQVFSQCRRWLQKNLPQAELIPTSTTSKAAALVRKKKDAACISSAAAAAIYHLNIVKRGIEDFSDNVTRFLLIGICRTTPTKSDKTSLLFSVKDKIGALHDMLVPFKEEKINLTRIESRPSKRKMWEYYFFVDLEGHIENQKIRKAIAKLKRKCNFLKILGSYPKDDVGRGK